MLLILGRLHYITEPAVLAAFDRFLHWAEPAAVAQPVAEAAGPDVAGRLVAAAPDAQLAAAAASASAAAAS